MSYKWVSFPYIFLVAVLGALLVSGSAAVATEVPAQSEDATAQNPGYTVENLLAHACHRLRCGGTCDVAEIRIENVGVYGLDETNAIVFGNYYVISDLKYSHIPSIRPLVFRTADGGVSWVEAINPSVPYLSMLKEIRFEAGGVAGAVEPVVTIKIYSAPVALRFSTNWMPGSLAVL